MNPFDELSKRRTKRGFIVKQLRLMWLKSRERSFTLKRSNYCCERCGVKKSEAKAHPQKVEVHHKKGIRNWNKIADEIMQELLCDPDELESLCPECHAKAIIQPSN